MAPAPVPVAAAVPAAPVAAAVPAAPAVAPAAPVSTKNSKVYSARHPDYSTINTYIFVYEMFPDASRGDAN